MMIISAILYHYLAIINHHWLRVAHPSQFEVVAQKTKDSKVIEDANKVIAATGVGTLPDEESVHLGAKPWQRQCTTGVPLRVGCVAFAVLFAEGLRHADDFWRDFGDGLPHGLHKPFAFRMDTYALHRHM